MALALDPLDDPAGAAAHELLAAGRVRRAYLGVAGAARPLPPPAARRLGRSTAIGVAEVVEGSPGARAGLRPGDQLLEVGGIAVRDPPGVGGIAPCSPSKRILTRQSNKGKYLYPSIQRQRRGAFA